MLFREALESMDNADARALAALLPTIILDSSTDQFTLSMFHELQKASEKYARNVPYTARIGFSRELNDVCDAFFAGAFGKVCRVDRIFDNTEMDILLLKELQGGSDESLYNKSQADRAVSFGMSTNAMQSRIHALEDGKEILGHHVKINIAGRRRTAYDDTIHPVFLTLNLKEAYFMTVEMRKAFAGTPFEGLSEDISTDIYSQLTDYARSVLQSHIEEAGIEYDIPRLNALTNRRPETHDAVYYLKSQELCLLLLPDGTTYTGRIRIDGNEEILLTTEGAKITLPDSPILFSLDTSSKSE